MTISAFASTFIRAKLRILTSYSNIFYKKPEANHFKLTTSRKLKVALTLTNTNK